MSAQLNDKIYAERQGIGGTVTVSEIISLATGGAATKEIEIDFGVVATNNKKFTIADTEVLTTSKVVATISGKPTADHSTDEIMILDLKAYVNNIVDGVSFDLIVFSNNKLKGKFNINYKL